MDNIINLVLASDDNYAQHAAVALMSAYAKCDKNYKINSYILDGGISLDKKIKIEKSIAVYNGDVCFISIDVEKFQNSYTSFQYTPAIYYRLDLPNILDKSIEKCLYVDCDILFMDDISQLWNTNLNGYPIGAIEDIGLTTSKKGRAEKQQSIGLKDDMNYFNSGVVIMDLQQWREKGYAKQAIDLALHKKFISHDQDILNKIFLGNWKEIDLRWNVIPPIFYLYPKILKTRYNRKRAIEAKNNMGILHYAGRYKAWEFKETRVFNGYYYELFRKSAFCDELMPQLSKQNEGRNFGKELIRIYLANMLSVLLK
ncbi:glycosyltransferase family 8 protein [uncultured Phascolarctobacterium sp.]|uniref:glycosyltransferase family 8 protein n=1 Tax=uncultured Phascolarctobacterium sp. TaxID=512296 RepID=UPI0026016B08|nr:glycosyltransferase family 8 protein [uncultured Phascolarctobacterium sp.]